MRSLASVLSAAIALFLVTIYAPFTVASILSKVPQAEPATFYAIATLVSMAAGTFLSGYLTNTALVLAPAIGMTLILQSVLLGNILSYRQALFASVIAGLFSAGFTYMSWRGSSLRFHILWSIPEEIKLGIKGGVGALLATQAISNFDELTGNGATYASINDRQMVLFSWVVAVLFLFFCDLRLRYLRLHEKPPKPRFLEMQRWFYLSATALVGAALAWIAQAHAGVGHASGESSGLLLLAREAAATAPAIFCAPIYDFSPAVPLILLLLFLFFTDIPGTPFEMLDVQRKGAASGTVQEPQQVRGSFWADATMAVVNPFLRISPSIYYAENLILQGGHEEQVGNRYVALLCAGLYLAVAFGLSVIAFDVESFRSLSLFAVSPILFYIGIKVVSSAMVSDHEKSAAETKAAEPVKDQHGNSFDLFYYLPAATAVILTPIPGIGFPLAIPISILVFAGCYLVRGGFRTPETQTPSFEKVAIALFAIASFVIIWLWLGFVTVSPGNRQSLTNDPCPLPPVAAAPVPALYAGAPAR